MKKVAVTSNAFSKNRVLRNKICKLFPNTQFNDEGKRFSKNGLVGFLKDIEAAVIGLDTIDDAVLEQLPNLKIIAKFGVGLDNIDLDACKKRNITVGWTGGINKLSVAEMTLGFMLGLSRNLYTTSSQLSKGYWNKSGGMQLTGRTVGIVGIGNIGKEVIRLLEPFKCNILVNDIIEQKEYYQNNNLKEASKEDIFRNSDIITIHTPLTDQTRHLIDQKSIFLMKSGVHIINTARGGIINLNDLKFALQNNIISGAAMDVYEVEPPEDKELLALDNFYCTPHIGGNSIEAVTAMGESAISHLVNFSNMTKNEKDNNELSQ